MMDPFRFETQMLPALKTSPTGVVFSPKPIPLDHKYPEESMEYQSLCTHYSKLLLIQCNPEKFAVDIFSEHIISARILSDIQNCGQEEQRSIKCSKQTRKLLQVVKNVVRADPGKFGDFVEVVRRYSPPLAKELEYTCGRSL